MEGDRPIRLTVDEMTPDEALLAVASQERELTIMTEHATPSLALLQCIENGDHSMTQRKLREAREMAATLHRVQQQTTRLRAAVRVLHPTAALRVG